MFLSIECTIVESRTLQPSQDMTIKTNVDSDDADEEPPLTLTDSKKKKRTSKSLIPMGICGLIILVLTILILFLIWKLLPHNQKNILKVDKTEGLLLSVIS